MLITSSTVCALISELREDLLGSQIKKFKLSPERKEILSSVRKGKESRVVLFSADPFYCRLVSLPEIYSRIFLEWNITPLFSQALDVIILDIEQIDFDRIIKFTLEKETEFGKEEFELFFELTGRNANVILVQKKTGLILDSLRKIKPEQSRVRQILPGIKYLLPPIPKQHNPYAVTEEQFKKIILNHPEENLIQILSSHFMGIDEYLAMKIVEESVGNTPLKPLPLDLLFKGFQTVFNQLSTYQVSPHLILETKWKIAGFSLFDLNSVPKELKISLEGLGESLQEFSSLQIEQIKRDKKIQILLKVAHKGMESLKIRMEKLKEELSFLQDAKDYKKFGDLILSNLSVIRKGAEFIELPDYSTLDYQKIKISLDPSLSPRGNAQAYYKKYRKAQTGTEKLKQRIAQTEKEIIELEKISSDLQKGEPLALSKVESKLSSLGLIKKPKPKKEDKKKGKYAPREFISADGWKILVGRSNRGNDYLTFKIAQPEDLWFHAQNIPGSHVVLRKGERNKNPTHKAIEQAASLAAYYSQARTSKKASVIYTLAKYVRKPKNAPPGLVKVEKMKSILVEPKLLK